MKISRLFLVFILVFAGVRSYAQQNTDNCRDIVHLKNGSVFKGKITALQVGGDLVMTTWNGVTMTIPESNVKRIVQRCKESKAAARPYDFKERGLYNATRLGVLIGQNYFGENNTGFTLSHCTGWMFRRWLGAGIGAGVEVYSPDGLETTTYPVFAEVRGYLSARNVTPFYSISTGWAFAGSKDDPDQFITNKWSGGWMAKAQIGYRIGNNLTLFGGISLQRKVRNWRSDWGGEWGQDRMLHKRLELGFGLVI